MGLQEIMMDEKFINGKMELTCEDLSIIWSRYAEKNKILSIKVFYIDDYKNQKSL